MLRHLDLRITHLVLLHETDEGANVVDVMEKGLAKDHALSVRACNNTKSSQFGLQMHWLREIFVQGSKCNRVISFNLHAMIIIGKLWQAFLWILFSAIYIGSSTHWNWRILALNFKVYRATFPLPEPNWDTHSITSVFDARQKGERESMGAGWCEFSIQHHEW